ncbi:VOC family protein [Pseudonocardia sp. TRM90224]|uniref:VOC family protein n=1 Tax=Pseudonocardia sp. TRM90224 TaxID=2812678 RepID=UPI001E532445|nr:VOC family protein [Pseudonocardia sp. TRM90224]
MASYVIAVAIDCHDTDRCAAFWSAALGTGPARTWSDARGTRYVQISPDVGADLLFQPVREPKATKNRVHLDITPETGTQATEVARLVELGANVVADEPDLPWVLLGDPEGNEFCVLPPRR